MIFSRFRWNAHTILELEQPSEAFMYFRSRRLNLLTGFPETYSLEQFTKVLEGIELQGKTRRPTVFHFYYEYGLHQAGLGHLIPEDAPVAVMLVYEKARKRKPRLPRLDGLPLQTLERPTWSEYKQSFKRVQEELLAGNCYQVNLTFPYDFTTEEILDPRDICDYFFAQKNLGAYAHATYLGEELILSNSPECLFQYRKNEIFTMPIKGTISSKGKEQASLWQEMLKDPKQEGELLMITDLLRNDLNRLQHPHAEVLKLRAPLRVPGLLHQYSLLRLRLQEKISLEKVMAALFPGGSITGAPKRRVMQIIGEVERFHRGIYCGSTVLCWQEKKVASINIRTVSVNLDHRIWRYGAGGGVTLLSNPVEEFQEMELKVASFLRLLKIRGY